MIKLHGFVPLWGLVDPSPYVTKAMTLFKMANIPFEKIMADLESVSKHKAPYLTLEDGRIIQDSSFIRFYLENELGVNFNANYNAKELAIGYAFERLCENHLNWIITHDRWLIDENFEIGPKIFFMNAPEHLRENIIKDVRERTRMGHIAQGISRHTEEEIFLLGKIDIDTISDFIGENLFLLGNEPCCYDASVHASLLGLSTKHFKSKTNDYIHTKPNLLAYIKRMNELYYG